MLSTFFGLPRSQRIHLAKADGGLTALIIAQFVATPARWNPWDQGHSFGVYTLIDSLREPFVLMRLTNPETLWTGVTAVLVIASLMATLHDRGKVVVQAMLMLAGGGESCADIEHLRSQERLFGAVPSDSTLYRTFRHINPEILARLWEAMAEVRGGVWRRSAATTGIAPVVLDIDASLVEVHSENKQGTTATYKGGFGFHPMLCFADATGETLAALLRPGNAGANTVADNLAVLDAAVAQLPPDIAAVTTTGTPRGW